MQSKLLERINKLKSATGENYVQKSDTDEFNNLAGELDGYDCKKCKNKGYVAVEVDGKAKILNCACQEKRKIIKAMKNSGVNLNCTFETFETPTEWQKQIFDCAKRYLNSEGWLYVGGQVGAGKTHICTAIIIALLEMGKKCKYMLWAEDGKELKANVNDNEEYMRKIREIKTAEVLYIDDFFKTPDSEKPTRGDVNLAFDILNYRYNQKLRTIISSEYMIRELEDVDEATGSRIFEMSKGNILNIKRDKTRNQRYSGCDEI